MFYKEYRLAQNYRQEKLAEADRERLLRAVRLSTEKPVHNSRRRFLPRGENSAPCTF
jgi:hypothetical protein